MNTQKPPRNFDPAHDSWPDQGFLLEENLTGEETRLIGQRLASCMDARPSRHRRAWFALVAAACIGVAGAGLYWVLRPEAVPVMAGPLVFDNHLLSNERVYLRLERTDIPGVDPVIIEIEVEK